MAGAGRKRCRNSGVYLWKHKFTRFFSPNLGEEGLGGHIKSLQLRRSGCPSTGMAESDRVCTLHRHLGLLVVGDHVWNARIGLAVLT